MTIGLEESEVGEHLKSSFDPNKLGDLEQVPSFCDYGFVFFFLSPASLLW